MKDLSGVQLGLILNVSNHHMALENFKRHTAGSNSQCFESSNGFKELQKEDFDPRTDNRTVVYSSCRAIGKEWGVGKMQIQGIVK